jgi:hypothetical protein
MQTKKAIGTRGSWLATVDGELLPCVHEYWWVKGDPLRRYNDPLLTPSPRHNEFVAHIKERRKVILTSDKPYSTDNPIPFERTGYIAIWTVEDVEFDENGLRFRFAERACNLI